MLESTPDRAPQQVLPPEARFRLLAEAGADCIVVARPTPEFLAAAPEQFVAEVIVGRFGPRSVVEGPGFHFGKDRAGSAETLRRLAPEGGFDVVQVEPVSVPVPGGGRTRVSSSLIRDLLRRGEVEAAAGCLGRDYVLYGRVVGGERRGMLLEFPTANRPG